jgi:hypothetical protein
MVHIVVHSYLVVLLEIGVLIFATTSNISGVYDFQVTYNLVVFILGLWDSAVDSISSHNPNNMCW